MLKAHTGESVRAPDDAIELKGLGLCAHLGGIVLGSLLFVVCVILQFHYHDPIPWYIWVLALIAQLVSFGEPAMRSAIKSKKDERSQP